ncbi:MAG: hypothetical protein CM15mP102_15110 [Flavobacteriales bacterium]|nr:MAG: hypothetical protein CM15mP102_15110 [Flavobacteriales bacterium]
MSFIFLFLPASLILLFTDFPFQSFTKDPLIIESIIYIIILAVFGTAIAKVLYIKLLAISSPVFSVSTTYLIPLGLQFLGTIRWRAVQVYSIFRNCGNFTWSILSNQKNNTFAKQIIN